MKIIDLTLPEFTFIDHIGYKDDVMKDQQCILHIRTTTILELIANDEVEYVLKREVKLSISKMEKKAIH